MSEQPFDEAIPESLKPSLFRWLTPFLRSTDFLHLVERRLDVVLHCQYGDRGAIESLAERMAADDGLFLDVLRLSLEEFYIGYSFQGENESLRELARYLDDARIALRLNVRQIPVGERAFRTERTLERRVPADPVAEARPANAATQRGSRPSGTRPTRPAQKRTPSASLVQSAERWYHDRSLLVQVLTLVVTFLGLLVAIAAIVIAVLIGNGTIKP